MLDVEVVAHGKFVDVHRIGVFGVEVYEVIGWQPEGWAKDVVVTEQDANGRFGGCSPFGLGPFGTKAVKGLGVCNFLANAVGLLRGMKVEAVLPCR